MLIGLSDKLSDGMVNIVSIGVNNNNLNLLFVILVLLHVHFSSDKLKGSNH